MAVAQVHVRCRKAWLLLDAAVAAWFLESGYVVVWTGFGSARLELEKRGGESWTPSYTKTNRLAAACLGRVGGPVTRRGIRHAPDVQLPAA